MRKAFQWTYEQIESGSSKSKIKRDSKTSVRLQQAVTAAYKQLGEMTRFDQKAFPDSPTLVGIDEVGRGPLAGPLVSVCIQLPYPIELPFLRDSKKLKASEREFLVDKIKSVALKVGYGIVSAQEFGQELNLHQLTFLAMKRAMAAAEVEPEQGVLVDGKFPIPGLSNPQKAVIKGDDKSLAIAAASVLAKVFRDEEMKELDREFPMYGFAKHVGYGTEAHRNAIVEHGPCSHHRSNFIQKILG